MRNKQQLAAALAIALGVGAPIWAGQRQNANTHQEPSHPTTSHTSAPAPHPSARRPQPQRSYAPPANSRPAASRNHTIPGSTQSRQVPRPPERQYAHPASTSNSVPRPPQNSRPVVHSTQSHAVPRPPQRNASPNVGAQANTQNPQHVVPRPPERGNAQANNGAQPNSNAQRPEHVVPRPPNATRSSVGQEPVVGNARPAVPRPPTIGTPRDVHQGSQPHAGDWLRRYSTMPAQQRQHALESDPAFRRLPSSEQQRYRTQLNQFSSKTPQEQQRVINRMDAWGHLTPQQQQQARTTYGQLKQMPADRQQQVNAAFRRLRAMPPSAREQVLNSPDFQSRYSEQERGIIKSMTDINASLPHD